MAFNFWRVRRLATGEECFDQCGGNISDECISFDCTSCSISWYNNGGKQLIKKLSFPVAPIDAKLFCFKSCNIKQSNASSIGKIHSEQFPMTNAMAVLLPNDELHICTASGETYDIHLPYSVKSMQATSLGLMFQRDTFGASGLQFLYLSNPLAQFSNVEYHESMADVVSTSFDHSTLCVDGNFICLVSSDLRTVSIVQVQSFADEGSLHNNIINPRGGPSSTNQQALSDLSFGNLMSPPPEGSYNPIHTGASSNSSGIPERSPMVLSRENSPAVLQASGSTGYSAHRSNDAALQSLLDSTPITQDLSANQLSTIIPLERTLSEGLSSTIRSQPLLYSRGTSGGSSNSNTAYHVRKKRAGISHSPNPSPRPSPSHFMFESSKSGLSMGGIGGIGGIGGMGGMGGIGCMGGMDVDISRQGPATDSPHSSNSRNFLFPTAATETVGSNEDILPAEMRSASSMLSNNPVQNVLSMAPSEVYLTRVAHIILPFQLLSVDTTTARFTGFEGSVGGWMLHLFEKSNGAYISYELTANIARLMTENDADFDSSACNSFFLHGASKRETEYTPSVVFSTTGAAGVSVGSSTGSSASFNKGGGGGAVRFTGIAHVSVPIGSLEESVALRHGALSVLPRRLQSYVNVPLTLLLSHCGTVLVLLGGQPLAELPLQWTDDLMEIWDNNAEDRASASEGSTLRTLQRSSSNFGVRFQDGSYHIVEMSSLFSSQRKQSPNVRNLCPARLMTDAAVATVHSLLDLHTEGLVESVLEFLVKVHSQVGVDCFCWLLYSACGIEFETFASNILSKDNEVCSTYLKEHHNKELEVLYRRLQGDTVHLYECSGSSLCLGMEVFHTLHTVLQEIVLRAGCDTADTERLKSHLSSVVNLLTTQVHLQRISPLMTQMRSACAAAMKEYVPYYSASSQITSQTPDVCANSWLAVALNEITKFVDNPTSGAVVLPVFPLPFPSQPLQLSCFSTIHLTARFLEYLSWEVQHSRAATSYLGSQSAARILLDAFTYSAHGSAQLMKSSNDTNTNSNAYADRQESIEWIDPMDAFCSWPCVVAYFPPVLRAVLELAITQCQIDPNPHWPAYLLTLVGRKDLGGAELNHDASLALTARHANNENAVTIVSPNGQSGADTTTHNDSGNSGNSDGLAELEKASLLRFTEDDRMHEVCRMLRSSKHLYLKYEKAPEVSELEHRHKLQLKLLNLVKRSVALPTGRGMLTIASLEPFMAETLPLPPISLTGRVPPANSIIALDTTHAHADLTLWPDFHNGVAAALRVGPADQQQANHGKAAHRGGGGRGGGRRVTRNWITYNRIVSQAQPGGEATHAGFLLGLGLFGHLTNLTVSDTFEYLRMSHEPTTVAVLLGSAASKVGTADPRVFKTISLYMPALLPAPHCEIDIPPPVQTAGLVGLGLLYCSSGHRMMAEFLLSEISRSPSPDHPECREAMVSAAAWSLGMILLGKGSSDNLSSQKAERAPATPAVPRHRGGASSLSSGNTEALRGLQDLRIENRLLQFIDGGKHPGESALFPSHTTVDISSRSSRLLEGQDINVNVTAPGATIALGLIFIYSKNHEISQRLALPSTTVALESMWSDLLLYRAVARCLVLGESVQPTNEWILSQIPGPITRIVFPDKTDTSRSGVGANVKKDPKLLYQNGRKLSPRIALSHYLCSISGFCLGIGLVHAGTSNHSVKQTILDILKLLQSFRDNKPTIKTTVVIDKILRSTIEMCTATVSLSLACVMAGSGDLDCLRIFRELRWKVEEVTYGTHMAFSMAIGLLFLGGGNFSLRRDPLSTACLLMAFLPKYPVRTVEQQYHLQATRHLYVLAVEPRALHTIDVDTGLTVPVDVDITLLSGKILRLHAPGLLPELSSIHSISVATAATTTTASNTTATNALSSDADPAPSIQYYPSTLVLNNASAEAELAEEIDFLRQSSKNRFLRRTHRPITVPPLFVKHMQSPEYLALSALSLSGSTAKPHVPIEDSALLDNNNYVDYLLHHAHHPSSSNKTGVFAWIAPEKEGITHENATLSTPMRAVAQAVERNPLLSSVLLSALTNN